MSTAGEVSEEGIISASNGKYVVKVITERCKECGLCIALCPTKVLIKGDKVNEKGYRYTVPEHIEKCIGCRICEISCPDFAIFVEEVNES
ncbi:MAG: 2-oxoglutarate ferredoxin oxidoreductase subunit delta [Thermoprotei archaeon]|nr:MAG: 2-oxoglutarate ferredoxin oxidoreductase subunit delta [Thermoprotei archaeon]